MCVCVCVRVCRCQGWLMSRPVGILVTLHWPSDMHRYAEWKMKRRVKWHFPHRDPNRCWQRPQSLLIPPAWEDDACLQSNCQRAVEKNMNAPSKVKRIQEIDWETKRERNKGGKREELTLCSLVPPHCCSLRLHTKFH